MEVRLENVLEQIYVRLGKDDGRVEEIYLQMEDIQTNFKQVKFFLNNEILQRYIHIVLLNIWGIWLLKEEDRNFRLGYFEIKCKIRRKWG